MRDVITAVAEQYEKYPYPPVTVIEEEDAQRNLYKSFNLELGLVDNYAINKQSKIWVPGCGTRWAVMIALQFKDTLIVASDLSQTSISLQKNIAKSLNINNIDFRKENILEATYFNEFDYISCVGVLHHLPDPRNGFSIVSKALKKTGLLEIMVYDKLNRHYSIRMQNILKAVDPDKILNANKRFNLAIKILKAANKNAATPNELRSILKYIQSVPGFTQELADFISHPQEHYFDVPSLISELELNSLDIYKWKMPHKFDPNFMLDDYNLNKMVNLMQKNDKAYFGQQLSSGLLEGFAINRNLNNFYTVKDSSSKRVVRAIPQAIQHHFSNDGSIIKSENIKKISFTKNGIKFDGLERRPAVLSYGQTVDCVRNDRRKWLGINDLGFHSTLNECYINEILSLAKKEISIENITKTISEKHNFTKVMKIELENICDYLCKTPFRLLAVV